MSRNRKSGASVGATAPAPAGTSVFVRSKICLAGAIALRVGVNELDADKVDAIRAKSPGLDRQLKKLVRAGLIEVSAAPPAPPAPPVETTPPPELPPELSGKTPAELEAMLVNAKSAGEANAITEALRQADREPAVPALVPAPDPVT